MDKAYIVMKKDHYDVILKEKIVTKKDFEHIIEF